MKNKQMIDAIRVAFINYLETYFVKRDLESTLKLFNFDITGFGTGIDEQIYGFETLKALYKRDIKQAPHQINYTINKMHISSPMNNLGIVSSELNIQTTILEQEIKLNNLRLSSIFFQTNEQWLLVNMHISLPTITHESNEAYPIKELEERNKVLQRLVNERTKELSLAISELKVLKGIIPICCSCKNIRDDEGYWNQLENYISEHSEAEFSHGICPDCAKKLYPNLIISDNKK